MEAYDLTRLGKVDEDGSVRLRIEGRLMTGALIDVLVDHATKPLGIVHVPGETHQTLRVCHYRLDEDGAAELAPMESGTERAALVVYDEHKRPKAS